MKKKLKIIILLFFIFINFNFVKAQSNNFDSTQQLENGKIINNFNDFFNQLGHNLFSFDLVSLYLLRNENHADISDSNKIYKLKVGDNYFSQKVVDQNYLIIAEFNHKSVIETVTNEYNGDILFSKQMIDSLTDCRFQLKIVDIQINLKKYDTENNLLYSTTYLGEGKDSDVGIYLFSSNSLQLSADKQMGNIESTVSRFDFPLPRFELEFFDKTGKPKMLHQFLITEKFSINLIK